MASAVDFPGKRALYQTLPIRRLLKTRGPVKHHFVLLWDATVMPYLTAAPAADVAAVNTSADASSRGEENREYFYCSLQQQFMTNIGTGRS